MRTNRYTKKDIIDYLNKCFSFWVTWSDAQTYAQRRFSCTEHHINKLRPLTNYNNDNEKS